MSKFGVLVMGPAGAGKHLRNNKRSCYYVNLDPAADKFDYQPDLDIADLITLEDVMEEMGLGPNGGLIYCFEFLLENLDFLTEAIDPLTEEYLIIIDMPGQIELYTHIPVVPALVRHLTRTGSLNVSLCATYLLESTFVVDRAKYFAGTLSAMSAMIMLEVPHVNVLSKMDLIKGSVPRKQLKRFLDPDTSLLDDDPTDSDAAIASAAQTRGVAAAADPLASESLMAGGSFKRLNRAVAQLIDDFSMVSFLQLDAQDEDSVGAILSYVDEAIQFHEAQEPREPNDELENAWEDADMS
ncbi:ATP binding protein [Schaereria dolodes]|nr:ATP binding protein [Schaereria dolodes]